MSKFEQLTDNMRLTAGELFAGETVIRSKAANAFLPPHPAAGPDKASKLVMYLLGKPGLQLVPGMLHLTNYRLKFKPAELPAAVFTIFLPTIDTVTDVSRLLLRKIKVTTVNEFSLEFGVWSIGDFIAAVDYARARAKTLDWDVISSDTIREADKVGDWAVQVA